MDPYPLETTRDPKNNIKEWSCHVMHGYYRALRPPPTSCYMAFSIDCIEHCIVIWLLLVLLLHVCTYMHGLHEKMHGTRLYKINGGIISDGGGGVLSCVSFKLGTLLMMLLCCCKEGGWITLHCTPLSFARVHFILHSFFLFCCTYHHLSLRGTWEEEAPKSQRINRATQ